MYSVYDFIIMLTIDILKTKYNHSAMRFMHECGLGKGMR